jgi:hypothetical protein
MQANRLLDDREVFVGDRLFYAQGRPYAFVEHSGGELVVTTEYRRSTRFKPEQLGCYVMRKSQARWPRSVKRWRPTPLCSCTHKNRKRYSRSAQESQTEATRAI